MIDSFTVINPKLIDQPLDVSRMPDGHSGYPAHLAAADTPDALKSACGSAGRDFPSSMWIEPKDREAKARENDENKTWGINFLDRFTHQGNSHECTTHMLRAEVEAARNRQRGIIFPDGPQIDKRYEQSQKGSVWVSPLSVYAEANPNVRGGAGCVQVLDIACRRGMLPEKEQPRDYGFKHVLQGTAGGTAAKNQSVGSWVRLSDFPANWMETAKWLMPEEVIVTTDPEAALCMLLHGLVLGYGRDGHAVPPAFFNMTTKAAGYVDSYNRVLYDSWSTFSRACRSGVSAILSMKTPDDWLNPGGNK